MKQILIVGGGYTGLIAANRLAKQSKKSSITMIEQSDCFFERIRLHQVVAGQNVKPIKTRFLLSKRVNLLQGRVQSILPDENKVVFEDKGNTQEFCFDVLLLATGSKNKTFSISGFEHAHLLSDHKTCQQQAAELASLPRGSKVHIVGGGFTGIELVAEIKEAFPGLHCCIISSGKVGEGLSSKGKQYLDGYLREKNIEVMEEKTVQAVERQSLHFRDGDRVDTNMVFWTAGFEAANPEFKHELGSKHKSNSFLQWRVLPTLQHPSFPNIFIAGDSAAFEHRSNKDLRMACATGMPMGVFVASNINRWVRGLRLEEFSFGYVVQCISLGRKNGLIQWVNKDDTPKKSIWKGWLGAWFKELICRFTLWSIKLERSLPFRFYTVPGDAKRQLTIPEEQDEK